MTKPKNIVLASQDKTAKYAKEIQKLLKALGHPEALVTDESKLWDFWPMAKDTQRKAKALSKKLGVPVNKTDYLITIAERMAGHTDPARWSVDVVKRGNAFATVFTVGVQSFDLAIWHQQEHCQFIQKMFIKAMGSLDLGAQRTQR